MDNVKLLAALRKLADVYEELKTAIGDALDNYDDDDNDSDRVLHDLKCIMDHPDTLYGISSTAGLLVQDIEFGEDESA